MMKINKSLELIIFFKTQLQIEIHHVALKITPWRFIRKKED
jgi:hypothetical protein